MLPVYFMPSKAHVENQAEKIAHADGFDDHILRRILCSVEDNAQLSQRQLSKELGIALGSVNWYLKRCINKGLIKISQASFKRYMYYLTPQGMDEKGRLIAQYLKWSLDFFRMGREESSAILARCALQRKLDIVLAGNSDLAEIFIMSAVDSPVRIHMIYEKDHKESSRLRIPITGTLPADARTYILTDLSQPQKMWDLLRASGIPVKSIIIPSLLYFRPATKESA